ncbi:retromer subunit VPS17 SCDLUD_003245 [Saccharomycodes ludwigii]|uniref:retromer subunit VPS17 n=1 Tax=Saccharomycodes ludwigii TaxID=36035 RepID=UPI001E8B96AC|nr:hypothetical protein SCDLUD_003245 [Saccharomycodes ludwigii]KAH3900273.1 hypothetical protein SCDLUD_003245 [Saccharomycodes ludwigii]
MQNSYNNNNNNNNNADDDDYDYDYDNNPFSQSFLETQKVQNESENNTNNPNPPENEQNKDIISSDNNTIENYNTNANNNTITSATLQENHKKFLAKYKLLVKITKLSRTSNHTITSTTGSISDSNKGFIGNNGSANDINNELIVHLEINTNLPTFRKKINKNIIKSFTEFELFQQYLIQDEKLSCEIFPPAIPMFKTSYGVNNEEDLFQLQKYYHDWFEYRICKNPVILKNEELAIFLESDYNTYYPVSLNSGGATLSVSSSNTPLANSNNPAEMLKRKTLKQLQPPFDECTELATLRPMVKSWRKNCQLIQEKLVKVCKQKQNVSIQENDLGKNLGKLTANNTAISTTTNGSLTNLMYKRLGKTVISLGDFDSILTTFNMATLYDGLYWCIKDLYNVKETLTNRHILMRDLINVQSNLKKQQDNTRKLRAKRDISPLKVDEAIRSLQRITIIENELRHKLDKMTNELLVEKDEQVVGFWEDQNLKFISQYALKNIEYERKKLSILEKIRKDVRNCDKRGGLSRLGRKNVLSDSTDNSSSSVNPNRNNDNDGDIKDNGGDSWSGNRRRDTITGDIQENQQVDKTVSDKNNDDNDGMAALLSAKTAASLLGQSTFV